METDVPTKRLTIELIFGHFLGNDMDYWRVPGWQQGRRIPSVERNLSEDCGWEETLFDGKSGRLGSLGVLSKMGTHPGNSSQKNNVSVSYLHERLSCPLNNPQGPMYNILLKSTNNSDKLCCHAINITGYQIRMSLPAHQTCCNFPPKKSQRKQRNFSDNDI